jgi:hypothetical protein
MSNPLTIELSRSERELLLNILDIDPSVGKKLATARITGRVYRVELTRDELSGLGAGLAAEAAGADDSNLRRAFEELQEKLELMQKDAGGETPS